MCQSSAQRIRPESCMPPGTLARAEGSSFLQLDWLLPRAQVIAPVVRQFTQLLDELKNIIG